MAKEKRLETIKQIITSEKISSQEELLNRLIDLGYELTQATLSRDLKHLEVGRIPSEDGFKYVLSKEFVSSVNLANQSTVITGFISIECSGNIAVIKTLPAYSHTIADFIDKAEMNEIIGTIAGNDTVIAVIREGITKDQIIKTILNALPELESKLQS